MVSLGIIKKCFTKKSLAKKPGIHKKSNSSVYLIATEALRHGEI